MSVDFDNATFRCAEPPFTCPAGHICSGGFCLSADAGTDGTEPGQPFLERTISVRSPDTFQPSDVTLYLLLTPDQIDYDAAGGAAEHLEFLDEQDRSLPFEVVTWDPAGSSQLWLRVSAFTEATSIRMRYGDPIIGGPAQPNEVWPGHGLVLHFEDDTTDSSPASVRTGLAGGATIGVGYVGNAASLNGIDGFVDLGRDLATFNGQGAATLSTWINYNPGVGAKGIVEFSNGPGIISRAVLSLTPEREARIAVLTEDGAAPGEEVIGGVIPDNTWHWLVGTADLLAGSMELYLDGELQGSLVLQASANAFPATDSDIAAIGKNETGDNGFIEANLDEARAMNQHLSESQVRILYQSMTLELLSFGPESMLP